MIDLVLIFFSAAASRNFLTWAEPSQCECEVEVEGDDGLISSRVVPSVAEDTPPTKLAILGSLSKNPMETDQVSSGFMLTIISRIWGFLSSSRDMQQGGGAEDEVCVSVNELRRELDSSLQCKDGVPCNLEGCKN